MYVFYLLLINPPFLIEIRVVGREEVMTGMYTVMQSIVKVAFIHLKLQLSPICEICLGTVDFNADQQPEELMSCNDCVYSGNY